MNKLLLASILLAGLGCTNIQPIGPLAKGKKAPPTGKELVEREAKTVAAPKPTPPAILIEPNEVTAENAAAAAQKIANEIDYDTKSMPAPSKTAEVSRYKDGVKQP
jgi:hypothetical protein